MNWLMISLRRAWLSFGALLLVSVAHGSPLFSIGEGGDKTWQQAVTDGEVAAVNEAAGLTWAAQQFYSTQVPGMGFDSYGLVSSNLENLDAFYEGHQSMTMSWTENAPTELAIAAWEYTYGVDPDLTGTFIDVSLFAPPGIWDVSVELIDINNFSRGWFIPAVTTGLWGNFTIRPDIAAAQGPFTAFFDQPGFDITQVISIRLDEAGNSTTFTPSASTAPMWNVWDHLRVRVPEPAPLLLVAAGIGLAGMCRLRRRLRV